MCQIIVVFFANGRSEATVYFDDNLFDVGMDELRNLIGGLFMEGLITHADISGCVYGRIFIARNPTRAADIDICPAAEKVRKFIEQRRFDEPRF